MNKFDFHAYPRQKWVDLCQTKKKMDSAQYRGIGVHFNTMFHFGDNLIIREGVACRSLLAYNQWATSEFCL